LAAGEHDDLLKVRLKPDATEPVRLKPDATESVRLKGDLLT